MNHLNIALPPAASAYQHARNVYRYYQRANRAYNMFKTIQRVINENPAIFASIREHYHAVRDAYNHAVTQFATARDNFIRQYGYNPSPSPTFWPTYHPHGHPLQLRGSKQLAIGYKKKPFLRGPKKPHKGASVYIEDLSKHKSKVERLVASGQEVLG